MNIVISTKALVGHLFWKDSIPNQAVDLAFTRGRVVHSDKSLLVLNKILMNQRFDKYLTPANRQEFIRLFKNASTHVEIREPIKICRDIQDNIILELAFNAPANYVISGEKELLEHDRFLKNIRVVTPGDFLKYTDEEFSAPAKGGEVVF